MAMNGIQFQTGLSMSEFYKLLGTESLCAAALQSARWPEGFRFPACGGGVHCMLRSSRSKVF
jgi:hypothetical protein